MPPSALFTPEAMLERLIGFDTVSRKSNLELIDFVRDYLDGLGIASELVFDGTGTKANLLATLGPPDQPGLVLSGHTDVVPVDGQAWTSDPFRADTRDGRIHGRGAADMKGFIAVALALAPAFLERPLEAPVHYALSFDEEVGCKGVPSLLDHLEQALPVTPRACVVGEPTGNRPVDGHKGKGGYICTVTGREAHSALVHLGVNAIEAAAEVIAYLRRRGRAFRAEGPYAGGFEPPHCTISTGTIEGGSALNIVPNHCRFAFEFRVLPGQDPNDLLAEVEAFADRELLPAMRAVAPDAAITFEELMAYPGLGLDRDTEIIRLCTELTGVPVAGKVAFGTEAGHFAARGIPTVVCGPGDIAVAHKPDEFVPIADLHGSADLLRRLVDRMLVA